MNGIEIYDMGDSSYIWKQYDLLQGEFRSPSALSAWWQTMRAEDPKLPVNPVIRKISDLGL